MSAQQKHVFHQLFATLNLNEGDNSTPWVQSVGTGSFVNGSLWAIDDQSTLLTGGHWSTLSLQKLTKRFFMRGCSLLFTQ